MIWALKEAHIGHYRLIVFLPMWITHLICCKILARKKMI